MVSAIVASCLLSIMLSSTRVVSAPVSVDQEYALDIVQVSQNSSTTKFECYVQLDSSAYNHTLQLKIPGKYGKKTRRPCFIRLPSLSLITFYELSVASDATVVLRAGNRQQRLCCYTRVIDDTNKQYILSYPVNYLFVRNAESMDTVTFGLTSAN